MKLNTWEASKLSLAGRVTLAQLALATIQTVLLPSFVCEEIDKMCRQFIWGSTSTERKVNLVPWEHVIHPKDMGGLGFRSAKIMNTSFLLKLAWTLQTDMQVLWAKVVKVKYKLCPTNVDVIPEIQKRV
ncbi:hypothetical protein MANES_06G141650v8 [Manihot esculenta]|uniref:Uncharacterized protein n=1 Tax=Manihot esculenta TaxID=3983 RepID=A0ACB7HMC2_MANES|nr:hypothetical protein MANES_06G141650v8 [Manihot esculenta]